MKRAPHSAIAAAVILAALGGSCASRKSVPETAAAAPVPRSAASATRTPAADSNSVPGIARREVIRRQELIRQMDEAAIRASQRMAEDDLEGAVEGYRRAMGNR